MTEEPDQSLPDLRALGAYLRQTREAHALTLEEAEMQTRIRLKFLLAIESGDFSILPSPAHAKGFLRNYARFLQLDDNHIVTQFSELSGQRLAPITQVTAAPRQAPPPAGPTASAEPSPDPQPAAPPVGHPPSPYPTRPSTYITPSQRVGPAAPAGLNGSVRPREATQSDRQPAYPGLGEAARPAYPSPAPPPEQTRPRRSVRFWQSDIFSIAILLVGFAVIIWFSSTQLSQIAFEDVVPTQPGSEFLQTFSANITAQPSATFAPTDTPSGDGPFIQFDRVVLSIAVEQRTWVRITVDGQIVLEEQVQPGSILQYEGQESIVVLAGNAAGLTITYNGQKLGPLGERGQVVERIYTVQGQVTPTYTPTVTTTPTSVPSPTPRQTPTANSTPTP